MPINHFPNNCRTQSNLAAFGLCDDPPPARNPAYIDETDSPKWIAIVNNPANKDVNFHAIDNCVTVLRLNGEMESRCDGILSYDNNLIFVELKDRAHTGWLGIGRIQLTETLSHFSSNNNVNSYAKVVFQIANKQRPISTSNYMIEKQKFKDATGYTLNVQQNITIS